MRTQLATSALRAAQPSSANLRPVFLTASQLSSQPSPSPQSILRPHTSLRTLHTTRPLAKQKGGKQNSKHNVENASSRSQAAGDDPFDFSTLESELEKTVAKLKDDLSKLRQGGRIGTELVEGLKVSLKDVKEAVRVGDLAQVVLQSGRAMAVLVGEEGHVKPVHSAIQGSTHSLNPQQDPHNKLQLNLPIPPPTKESRDNAKKEVDKAGGRASDKVKEARGAQQKTFRAMEVSKRVRGDDVHKAKERMEKKVKEVEAEVKKIVEGARRAMDG